MPDLTLKKFLAKAEEMKAAQAGPKYPEVEVKSEITIDDFDKVQIQVGEILQCEPVKKAKKLLVSRSELGTKSVRLYRGLLTTISQKRWLEKLRLLQIYTIKLCGILSRRYDSCCEEMMMVIYLCLL